MTATPERSDGLPIVQLFDYRIAAELRLWDAIDQGFCVRSCTSVCRRPRSTRIPWRRGRVMTSRP